MTITPPPNFVKRDWDAPEHKYILEDPTFERFDIWDGPTSGNVESFLEADQQIFLDIGSYGFASNHMIDVSLDDAKRLRDDLTAVLEQIGA